MGDGKASQPVTSDDSTDLRLAKPIMREIPVKPAGGGGSSASAPTTPAPAPVAKTTPPPLPQMDRAPTSTGAPGGTASAAAVPPPLPPLLFEVAWEVCWQLGGIYTVLRSKAGAMQQHWDDR